MVGLVGAVLVVKDLWYLSLTHRRWGRLSLEVSLRGWDVLSITDDSFAIVLRSPTTSTGSRGHPRTQLAFLPVMLCLLSAVKLPSTPADPLEVGWCHQPKQVLGSSLCIPEGRSLQTYRVCSSISNNVDLIVSSVQFMMIRRTPDVTWMFSALGGECLHLRKSSNPSLVFPALIWRRLGWHPSTKQWVSSLSSPSVMRPWCDHCWVKSAVQRLKEKESQDCPQRVPVLKTTRLDPQSRILSHWGPLVRPGSMLFGWWSNPVHSDLSLKWRQWKAVLKAVETSQNMIITVSQRDLWRKLHPHQCPVERQTVARPMMGSPRPALQSSSSGGFQLLLRSLGCRVFCTSTT